MSEDAGPLAGLRPADRKLLKASPLELAVLEVRIVATAVKVAVDVALTVQGLLAELGRSFPRLEPAQENRIDIQMQPGAAPASHVQVIGQGWHLYSADGAEHITLLPQAVVMQTTRYERWSTTMRPVLEVLVGAAERHLAPSIVDRIGLRYVDRFVDVTAQSPADWRGRIHPDLLGAACHPDLAPFLRGAQQQVELGLGPAQGALLRHGPFVDPAAGGSVSYLVDIDVYDGGSTRFSTADVVHRAEVLNRTAASLFQSTVTPEYLTRLQNKDLITGAAITLGEPV